MGAPQTLGGSNKQQGGPLSSEAAGALAFVLEGELEAAWSLQIRQQLLLQHADITPEAAFNYLDKDGIGIVSKSTHTAAAAAAAAAAVAVVAAAAGGAGCKGSAAGMGGAVAASEA